MHGDDLADELATENIQETPMTDLGLQSRAASKADLSVLQTIREAAFEPVFASFKKIPGDVIYEAAQAHEDADQENALTSMFDEECVWRVTIAESDGAVVGFVAVRIDEENGFGEIGPNAIAPQFAGKGFGTVMYEHALQ